MIGNDKASSILIQGMATSIELCNEEWPDEYLSVAIRFSDIEYGITQRLWQGTRQAAIGTRSPVCLDNPVYGVEAKKVLETHDG